MRETFVTTLLLFLSLFTATTSAASTGYLYSPEGTIQVRAQGSLSAPTLAQISAGESFQITKWNRFNTRIKMKDGRIGWINRSLVNHLAPADETGFLTHPLTLIASNDKSHAALTSQHATRPGPAINSPSTASGNSEVVGAGPTHSNDEDDYASDYDDNIQENGYQNRLLAPLLKKVATEAWKQATTKRTVATFCGGGFRSGNRSKCSCAGGVKDTLIGSGLCKPSLRNERSRMSRGQGPAAIEYQRLGLLTKHCPRLKEQKNLNIGSAPGGSVIVYRGHAGKRVHHYGHIEIKVPVTHELLQKMGAEASFLNVKLGDFLYCSDFCRNKPTKTATNQVAAIYTLK